MTTSSDPELLELIQQAINESESGQVIVSLAVAKHVAAWLATSGEPALLELIQQAINESESGQAFVALADAKHVAKLLTTTAHAGQNHEPLSAQAIRALRIVRAHGPIAPREFARKMWPDAEGWNHHTKAGPYGSTKGGGMNLVGGGYLGKLRRKGWVRAEYYTWRGRSYLKGHVLTAAGAQALAAAEASDNTAPPESTMAASDEVANATM